MSTRRIAYTALLAGLYVAVGQLTRYIPNPMVPGANIALNMTIVVVAGALLGPGPGALVGLIGTTLNALSPAGNAFEYAAILPHTVMGFTAGLIGRANRAVAAFAILVGHGLNILAFVIARLMPANQVAVAIFSIGLLTETVIDLIVIWLLIAVLGPIVRSAPAWNR